MYTFGGTAADVLTTSTGDVVPDYPVVVYRAGTSEQITALYELDGVTPIAELRSNPAGHDQPGAIREFRVDGVTAIDFSYTGSSGQPVRWYQAARELAQEAAAAAAGALSRSAGGTVTAPLTVTGTLTASGGAALSGGVTVDDLAADALTVGGEPVTPSRMIDVTGYGTAGDGVTDDAPAIQAALTAAWSAGGGWVIVPPGDYLLATLPLRIRRRTRLTLLPGARFIRGADATVMVNGDTEQDLGGYTGHGDLLIEGGVWEMQGTVPGLTASRMCISLAHAERVTIRDIEVRDVPGFHAIELNSTKTGRVLNCRFLGFVDPGGREFSEAVQLDLAKSASVYGAFGPYDHTVCDDILIEGCTFGPSGTAGTTSWPRGVGSHSATITCWHTNVRVIGNHFEDCAQYAMTAYSYKDCVFSGNTITGCGAGFRAQVPYTGNPEATKLPDGTQTNASQDCSGFTIVGNTFRDLTGFDDAIRLHGEDTGHILHTTITGNTIDGMAGSESAIRTEYADHYTATGNVIANLTGGSGVSQANPTGAVVAHNRLHAIGYNGISADAGDDIVIASNSITETGNNGVHVVGGSDVRVDGNEIRAVSSAAAGNYGIRISSSAASVMITGNRCRLRGSGNEAAYGLSITSTCTGIRRYGNDMLNSGTAGEISDGSTSPVLSPYDAGTP